MNGKTTQNIYIILMHLISGYIRGIFTGLCILFGKNKKEQKRFAVLNFIIEQGPRGFWKDPTGIRAGRSLFIPLLLLFFRDTYFTNSDIDHDTHSKQ